MSEYEVITRVPEDRTSRDGIVLVPWPRRTTENEDDLDKDVVGLPISSDFWTTGDEGVDVLWRPGHNVMHEPKKHNEFVSRQVTCDEAVNCLDFR